MVKVIFFDVDGTLISHSQNAVPESTRTALNQLSEKGIQRVIATGRHMLELSLLPVSNIRFDAYITLNGKRVIEHILKDPICNDTISLSIGSVLFYI